ncbi:MAG TPA: tryptophan-rich sensory protein [Caldisericia bacterium]|nr:tryptophan-rich sensory protein [Caldisericia bacterium]HPF49186.1 tryptophan-rich sensory protein [Caldisericia bacterium]HPI84135.1 tryptophan-rich sensory protein [Caldisericia bacterium]HPQ93392.1 tryptophan-rich sensory protein [Caldisericia bacterium]HRV75226.1 tryptophan-rich sensory protein [Caldisericia bacterium]
MRKSLWLGIIGALTFVGVLVVNALASTVGINGLKTGEISDTIKSLFTPAGYTFSIWGIIYLLLACFVVYQLLPLNKDRDFQEKIGYWFAVSNLINIAWMFCWHYKQFLLSLVVMVCFLVVLGIIYVRIKSICQRMNTFDRLFVQLPFSVYIGWISVALIANASVALVYYGWGGFGISPSIWTAIMISVATLLCLYMVFVNDEKIYPLVIIWALIGILVANSQIQLIVVTAWVCVGITALSIFGDMIYKGRKQRT